MNKMLSGFYNALRRAIGTHGIYTLAHADRTKIPPQGVYIFFDHTEPHDKELPGRVVRIGTHAISYGSKSTLWNRLNTHRGSDNGNGNHRGSIFRKHIGVAICRQEGYPLGLLEQWETGSKKPKNPQYREDELEKAVSAYIWKLPFTILAISGDSSSNNKRAIFERQSIALLSWAAQHELIAIGTNWLGRETKRSTISDSGLWNIRHVWSHKSPLPGAVWLP